VLPDLTVGCLYECGEQHANERIAFARFSLEWLTDGAEKLSPPVINDEREGAGKSRQPPK